MCGYYHRCGYRLEGYIREGCKQSFQEVCECGWHSMLHWIAVSMSYAAVASSVLLNDRIMDIALFLQKHGCITVEPPTEQSLAKLSATSAHLF